MHCNKFTTSRVDIKCGIRSDSRGETVLLERLRSEDIG